MQIHHIHSISTLQILHPYIGRVEFILKVFINIIEPLYRFNEHPQLLGQDLLPLSDPYKLLDRRSIVLVYPDLIPPDIVQLPIQCLCCLREHLPHILVACLLHILA